jgi:hypothetical protein
LFKLLRILIFGSGAPNQVRGFPSVGLLKVEKLIYHKAGPELETERIYIRWIWSEKGPEEPVGSLLVPSRRK